MRLNLFELWLVLLALFHTNSFLHFLFFVLFQGNSLLVLVCDCLSSTLAHKHPLLPLYFCFRAAACLFPLLFCPPLERDWKVYAYSSIQSPLSEMLLAIIISTLLHATTSLRSRVTQLNNDSH